MQPLWVNNRWDGPLCGAIVYKDDLYYYNIAEDYTSRRKRRFWLIRLTFEQKKILVDNHELWKEYLITKDKETLLRKIELNYDDNEVIGWFMF